MYTKRTRYRKSLSRVLQGAGGADYHQVCGGGVGRSGQAPQRWGWLVQRGIRHRRLWSARLLLLKHENFFMI